MTSSTLIILTRNEIEGLRTLIEAIPVKLFTECFAIDYNSTDGTVEFVKKHFIRVIRQSVPGRGEAFRLGSRYAKGENLVFFSPDGNEDPRDIPKLLALLEKGYDMAIASRFMKGSKNEEDTQVIKFRAWANRAFTLLADIAFGGRITDSINGYRAITKAAFNALHLDAEGFAIEYQMTIRSLKLGMKIAELPTRESQRIGGSSTAFAIPTGLKVLNVLIKEIIKGKNF